MTSVLYINSPGNPNLPALDALNVIAEGAQWVSVSDLNAAKQHLQANPKLDVVVSNIADLDFFTQSRQQDAKRTHVLATAATMDTYSKLLGGKEEQLIDHVIAHRQTGTWLVDELRVTLRKIITGDIFGIEKYLAPGTDIQRVTVESSGFREQYNTTVSRFAEECRLGAHVSKSLWGICEEMLMNAIYDAPAAKGITRFLNIPRTTKIDLLPDERPELSFGFDGDYFLLSVTDPFGLMTKAKLGEYAKKILRRGDSLSIIDTKAGGAGLGLFKILFNSHALIFNVEAGKRTEIMAIMDFQEQLRDFSKMTRSLHFFSK